MRILFLGPPCDSIECDLNQAGHEVDRTEKSVDVPQLTARKYDYGISYRYKEIIKAPVIEWFGGRLINLHGSLLPWNRGYHPNVWSFLENTPKGVSIHVVDEGIDTGPILLQKSVDFDLSAETLSTSWQKLSRALETLFISHRDELLAGTVKARAQVEPGTFHLSIDLTRFDYLLNDLGWDTPVAHLIGRGLEKNHDG